MPWRNSLKQHLNSKTRAKSLQIKAPHFCPVLAPPCPSLICSPRFLCRSPSLGGGEIDVYICLSLELLNWDCIIDGHVARSLAGRWRHRERRGVDFCPLFHLPIYTTLSFPLCLCPFFSVSIVLSRLTCLLFETLLSACTHPEVSTRPSLIIMHLHYKYLHDQ